MNKISPEVGCWYKELQQGILFEVVAVDDAEQTIETQMIDGALAEYDMDSWREMLIETIEEPEDWRAGYELSSEDYLDPGDTYKPEEWSNPLNLIETDIVNGLLDEM
jgi:hypothetical protein